MDVAMLKAVLTVGAGALIGITGTMLIIYREVQRLLAFDRRLAVPRGKAAAAFGVQYEHRPQRGDGPLWVRTFGLAVLKVFSMLVPVGTAERGKLARLLRQAGFGQRDALSVFLSVKLAFAAVACAGTGLWARGSELIGAYGVLVALAMLAGFVVGGIVPEYVLRARAAGRTRRMGAALPDALDLMVMCLESGLTFERGLATVAEELAVLEPNLAGELRLLEAELRLGADRRAVLQAFQRRTEVEGLQSLAMTLIQAERYGTPLIQSMKNIAANERTQRAARIETQVERLPVLMTLPMILLVVPGTVMLVAGPAFLTAMQALRGLGSGE